RQGVLLRLKGVGTNMSDEKNQEKQDLQERIIALIEDILGVPVGTITLDTLIEDVEEWDSLMHVTIIGELEEQLGLSIPLDDAIALQSMQELLEKAGCV
ncbi:MAG: acyl carrier protein, partial [Lachnospiraceae bacterium]|nr:acyl carrier protein [Lachnospiraceae bacterium]